MRHLAGIFKAIDYWRLRPAQDLLVDQPGTGDAAAFISVAAAPAHDLLVAYTPVSPVVALRTTGVPSGPAIWMNPPTGERTPAVSVVKSEQTIFTAPAGEDWLLVVSVKPLRQ
jgi:hypothetical protein